MRRARLVLRIDYDPRKTDAGSLARAMDKLTATAMSVAGREFAADYGSPEVGEFLVLDDAEFEDPPWRL